MPRLGIRSYSRLAILIPVLTLAAIGGAFAVGATDEPSNPAMAEQMSKVKRAMRKLRRQVSDPAKNASSLEHVLAIQGAAQAAKSMEPIKAAGLEGKAKAEFVRDYRLSMINMQKMALDLEAQLLAGDNAKAKATYDKLNESQRPAHKKFRD